MTTQAAQETREPQLKRHVGVVGLLFASVGSIIGSGLALRRAQRLPGRPGPAAIISWALGGILILLIALVYAELGTMFPLSGGVVRFPHMAFGHLASFTVGLDHLRRVATTAPIEVEAALQYGTKYAAFTTEHTVGGETVHTLTALGYGGRGRADGALRASSTTSACAGSPGSTTRWSAGSCSSSCWSSSRSSSRRSTASNFTLPRLRARRACTASSPRSRPAASCSPTSASARASSSPARPTTPSATCRSP